MSSNILNRLMLLIYKHFKFIWIITTLLSLVLALYFNLQVSYTRSHKEVIDLTKDLSKQVDGFMEDLFQEVYTLPLYSKNFSKCDSKLSVNLEHIILNNPKISGLTIKDKSNHTLCSTIPKHLLNTTSTIQTRRILGPFNLSLFDQPVYVIRQKISFYDIDILLVSSILTNVLKTSNTLVSSVALYDEFSQRELLRIQYNEDSGWILSPNTHQFDLNPPYKFIVDKLQSIEGLVLKVLENKTTIQNKLWLSELFILLSTLIVAYIFYALINYNISKQYSLHRALKVAIKNKQFYPEYQPVFDLQQNTFIGVELLARWKDQDGEVVMPDSFIEEAESTGLIIPITLQIIETAFFEFKELLKLKSHFHLAINLSGVHFKDPLFFNKFNVLKKHYGIEAHQILFEITERDLLDKNDLLFITKMNELRESGFALAIDDYGTGHASISYLQHFPFNYLKIDKLFIQAIGTKAITELLNDAIIQMAKGLNLKIIAEGVETQEQVDYLAQNEVSYLQGWYFSKAVSIEKIKELILGTNNEL